MARTRRRSKGGPLTDKAIVAQADRTRQTIKTIRKQKKLIAEMVAGRIGISRPFYTQLEGGKRRMSIEYLFAIARALEVKPEVLVK